MATVLNSFGLTAEVVKSKFPHYNFSENDALEPERLAQLCNRAAAQVCAYLLRNNPSLDLSAITESDNPIGFLCCQEAALSILEPEIAKAVNPNNVEMMKSLFVERDKTLQRLIKFPDFAPQVASGTVVAEGATYATDVIPAERGVRGQAPKFAAGLKW
jgi:hypothetical protein